VQQSQSRFVKAGFLQRVVQRLRVLSFTFPNPLSRLAPLSALPPSLFSPLLAAFCSLGRTALASLDARSSGHLDFESSCRIYMMLLSLLYRSLAIKVQCEFDVAAIANYDRDQADALAPRPR